MDDAAKKTALRMIPYGIYIMTAGDSNGRVGGATVNWVTQTSFDPPLIAVGLKADAVSYGIVKSSRKFALNMLGKSQQGVAFSFFKPAKKEGNTLSGEPIQSGKTGSPILENSVAVVECEVREIVETGDHHIVIGEVVEATVNKLPDGRPDEAILEMKELGDNVFYGG